MALIIKDRVKEGTTSTGTGSIALAGSSATFDAFNSYMTDGDTTYYSISHSATGVNEWEVGLGTWNTGNTLTRTTVLAGSAGTSAVDFSAGTKNIFMTYPSAIAAYTDGSGDLSSLIGLGNHTTTDVAEGDNLYFTTGRIDGHLSGGTGVTYNAGAISVGQAVSTTSNVTFNTVTLSGNPATALQAATKEYVDTIAASGIHYHEPVRVEAATNRSATYNNGTAGVGATLTNSGTQEVLVIDGVTVDVADRVLLQQQTNPAHNGIYTVTNVGSASTNWVLTRATDTDSYHVSDKDALGEGDAFFVKEGLVSAGDLYVMNTTGVITFGTTPITFTIIAETAVYTAGTGLTLTGTEFATAQDIAATASPTFVTVNANLLGNVTGDVTGNVSGTSGSTTGNAATATKLATARTVQLSGDVTGSASFDGSANINIVATVGDDSHAHVIANVDDLQDALDAKVDDTQTITAGTGLTGGGDLTVNRTLSLDTTYTDDRYVNVTGDTMTGNLSFGNNNKAVFGTGSSLEIYGTGSHSYIDEVGTGNLYVRSTKYRLANADGSKIYMTADDDTFVQLYDNSNAVKLATTATGIDVTGSANVVGTVVAKGFQSAATNSTVNLLARNSTNPSTYIQNGSTGDVLHVRSGSMAAGTGALHLKVESTGDISFYEDTGNTAKMVWSASDEKLTLSGTGGIDVTGTINAPTFTGALSGNATTATTLATARTINGVSFNGSANITVADANKLPLAGGTLTGNLAISNDTPVLSINDTNNGDGGGFIGHIEFNNTSGESFRIGDWAAVDETSTGGPDVLRLRNSNGTRTVFEWGQAGTTAGSLYAYNQRVFADDYHPNADTLTTARTINGVAFDGSANITVADATKLPLAGGTVTGTISAPTFNATSTTNGGFQGIDADSITLPSFTWTSDQNTGMWHAAADQIGFTTAGVNRLTLSNSALTSTVQMNATTFNATSTTGGGFQGIDADTAAIPSFTWSSDLNTGMWHSGTDALGFTTAGVTRAQVTTSGLKVDSGGIYNTVNPEQAPISALTLTTGGTGFTDGTYTNVAITGGSYGLMTVVVAGGIVTSVTLTNPGYAYMAGVYNISTQVTGAGSGATVTIAVQPAFMHIYANPGIIRFTQADSSSALGQEIGSIRFAARDAGTNGSGDTARIVGRTRSTTGGGELMFQTTNNAGGATLKDTLLLQDGNATFYNTASAATFNATSTTSGGFQGIDADSNTNPSFTWTADLNTGMYRATTDQIGFTTAGTNRLTIANSLITSTVQMNATTFNATSTTSGGFQGIDADSITLPSFTWTSDLNTGMWHAAADAIGFTTGGVNRITINNSGISGAGEGLTSLNASNISSGTIAAARVPTLNQNTTGSAATLTTARTINGVSFDGSANITVEDSTKAPTASPTFTGTVTAPTFSADSTTNGGFQGIDADTELLPSFTWTSDQDTGMWHGGTNIIGFTTAGVNRFTIDASGNVTATGNVTAYSDVRLKSNIKTIESGLDKVCAMRGVTFEKDGVDGLGVIAQEVEQVIPEVVFTDTDGMKSVAYANLVGVLIEAIKELKLEVETLKAKL